MPWTARVTNKTVNNGAFSVILEFTDGTNIITETHRSTNPTATWIPNTVRDRIASFLAVYSFDIPIGSVSPSGDDVVIDNDSVIFEDNIRKIRRVAELISAGVITKTDQRVTALASDILAKLNIYWSKL